MLMSRVLAVLLLSAVLSCERRPLVDQISNVYLDLEIEDEITNYELESLPSLMKVNFYDPEQLRTFAEELEKQWSD